MLKFAKSIVLIFLPLYLVLYLYTQEGSYFPVVDNVRLTSVTDTNAGNTIISGSFTKLRNCRFLGIRWFYGKEDASVLVPSEFHSPPKIRTTGEQEFSNLEVELDSHEVLTNSYAYVYHECRPYWLLGESLPTRTLFFKSN